MLKRAFQFIATCALLLGSCTDDLTNNGGNTSGVGDGPAEGQITLYLGTKGISSDASTSSTRVSFDGLNLAWEEGDALIINRKTYYVEKAGDKAVVYVDKADDGRYEAFYPALLYDRADKTFTLPFSQFYREESLAESALPMYGVCTKGNTIDMAALCAILRVKVAGDADITSVYVEDLSNGYIAGEYKFSTSTLELSEPKSEAPKSSWVTLNCAGKENGGVGLSASGTVFNIVIPAGSYSKGFKVRISDRSRKKVEKLFTSPREVKVGSIIDLGVVEYNPDANLLYAQHFDNCTWGGDIVAGERGLGRGNTATDIPATTATGVEIAVRAKDSTTPGTMYVTSTDYINYTYNSSGLSLSKAYMRNRGLDDWRLLYMMQEYKGYLCGGDTQGRSNRGMVRFPFITSLGSTPCMAEVSFRICLEAGFEGHIELQAASDTDGDKVTNGSGLVFLNYWVDGKELDISPATSTRLSQASQSRNMIIIHAGDFVPGKWHDVKLRVGALSSNTAIRLMPSVIRNGNNIYFIDDYVVTRIPYGYTEDDYVIVEPTTELGGENEDVSRLRLRVGTTGSLTNDALFSGSDALGYTYISPGFGSKENATTAYDKWVESARKGAELAKKHNRKIWCMHLPYGNQTEERYYDPCTPDEKQLDSMIRYFSAMIRAARELQPKYLLLHCNQTLQFNDGSTAENMPRALYELQLVADEIGTQIAVENMSHGVGADSKVLSECVDKANAMTTKGALKRPVKIAVDIGHANVYLSIVNDGRDVVDWLRECGPRVGALHMHDNRGRDNDPTRRRYYDDHLYPGYPKTGGWYKSNKGYGSIGERNLWGELYYTLLKDCRYRGPFDYELSNRSFGTLSTILGTSEERTDQVSSPWHCSHHYDTYLYPAYLEYIKGK
jgi:sugar phosphate isomerase/epimerase